MYRSTGVEHPVSCKTAPETLFEFEPPLRYLLTSGPRQKMGMNGDERGHGPSHRYCPMIGIVCISTCMTSRCTRLYEK